MMTLKDSSDRGSSSRQAVTTPTRSRAIGCILAALLAFTALFATWYLNALHRTGDSIFELFGR